MALQHLSPKWRVVPRLPLDRGTDTMPRGRPLDWLSNSSRAGRQEEGWRSRSASDYSPDCEEVGRGGPAASRKNLLPFQLWSRVTDPGSRDRDKAPRERCPTYGLIPGERRAKTNADIKSWTDVRRQPADRARWRFRQEGCGRTGNHTDPATRQPAHTREVE